MCGIAGYFHLRHESFAVDSAILESVQNSLKHRGPDGYRIWTSPAHGVGLIHRRLSIMDLSENGFQPFFDDEKTVAVCCNGEIYNYKLLRAQLESLGYRFRSNSDNEVLVYGYKAWGIALLDRLEGMFAIVIVDLAKNELYLVRDRIGIKPLYFSLEHETLIFASEIKALWQFPWMQRRINDSGLYHYLTYLATPAPMTLFKGVYKLPPSFYCKVDAQKKITFTRWYNPLVPSIVYNKADLASESFCVENIRTLLKKSIEKKMMSDVPFGVFLSGGIDSSLNVALMAQLTDKVKTFNVSFSDGPEYNEAIWARKVAQQYNTEHYEISISEKEAFEFFSSMVYHQDEPLADCVCIPLYYVSKLLKDSGVTVVQVGEGSDELFCGYSTYASYLTLYERYWRPTQALLPHVVRQGLYEAARPFFAGRPNRRDVARNWAEGRNLFWSGATAFSEEWKRQIVLKNSVDPDPIVAQMLPGFSQTFDSYALVDYYLHEFAQIQKDGDFLSSMIYLELMQRLPELLLMRVDKMTMATAVEARVPFLDHPFVEFALQIPQSLKYKNGQAKYILKKAAEGILPDEIIYRKKMGFAAPTSRWFTSGTYFRPFFEDMLISKRNEWQNYLDFDAIGKMYAAHGKAGADYAVQLWVIQNLLATDVS